MLNFFALIYGAIITLRGKMYDWGLFSSKKFDIPIICIGNITVGGTGKTPMAESLITNLSNSYNIAILSRGYGRRTRGYTEVKTSSHYLEVGDEPLQIKCKFPNVVVVVCENRCNGIRKIQELHPDINLIIMDDGFQHRRVEPTVNIVMIDATRPVHEDKFLPKGRLRDTLSSLHRANYFIVTKCPADFKPIDRRIMYTVLTSAAYQKVYYTRFKSYNPEPIFRIEGVEPPVLGHQSEVIVMSGIANPAQFTKEIESHYKVVDTLIFNDHHRYINADLKSITELLDSHPKAVIVTTEKDAVKLMRSQKIPAEIASRLLYVPISIDFIDGDLTEFYNNLYKDVKRVL